MTDFLFALAEAVLIAAVPVVAVAFVKSTRATTAHLSAQMKNETAERYLEDASDAVCTAVAQISQTFVDSLKAKGEFTEEKQKEALDKALEQAKSLLTAEARDFLEKAYGDLASYLTSKIEAEVRRQKNEEPVAVGIAELSEVRESPDVATVAATTAAATAAAVVQQSVAKTESVTQNISVTASEEEQTK